MKLSHESACVSFALRGDVPRGIFAADRHLAHLLGNSDERIKGLLRRVLGLDYFDELHRYGAVNTLTQGESVLRTRNSCNNGSVPAFATRPNNSRLKKCNPPNLHPISPTSNHSPSTTHLACLSALHASAISLILKLDVLLAKIHL